MSEMDTRETMTEAELRERFNEVIDETHATPAVNVIGYAWNPSYVLEQLDPIAYQEELRNYADSLRDDFLVPGWND